MVADVNWRDVLSPELVRQIDDEISRQFAEGWRACQRSVAALEPRRNVVQASSSAEPDEESRRYPTKRAPKGFWDDRVVEAARDVAPSGLSSNDLIKRAQAKTHEHNLSRSSFNVIAARLQSERRIRKDEGSSLWFLGEAEQDTSAIDDDDGGREPHRPHQLSPDFYDAAD